MILVYGVLLILFEWYWYVVCESGIRTSLILLGATLLILFEWYWYAVCESGIRTSLILLGATAGSAPQKVPYDPRYSPRRIREISLRGSIKTILPLNLTNAPRRAAADEPDRRRRMKVRRVA